MRTLLSITVAAVAIGCAAATSAAAPVAAGVEQVPMICAAEWNPASDLPSSVYLSAPDTPVFPENHVTGTQPYAVARGTGLFHPSGRFVVVCNRDDIVVPAGATRLSLDDCTLYRGGANFSLFGARVYRGKAVVVATRRGAVMIGCQGTFRGIYTEPGNVP